MLVLTLGQNKADLGHGPYRAPSRPRGPQWKRDRRDLILPRADARPGDGVCEPIRRLRRMPPLRSVAQSRARPFPLRHVRLARQLLRLDIFDCAIKVVACSSVSCAGGGDDVALRTIPLFVIASVPAAPPSRAHYGWARLTDVHSRDFPRTPRDSASSTAGTAAVRWRRVTARGSDL